METGGGGSGGSGCDLSALVLFCGVLSPSLSLSSKLRLHDNGQTRV